MKNRETISFYLKVFSLHLVFLIVCCDAFAQERRANEDEVRETVKMWLLYKLKTEVILDQDTCITVLDEIDKVESARKNLHKLENRTLRELDSALQKETISEEEIAGKLKNIDQEHAKLIILEKQYNEELKKLLNPVQRAKFMIIQKKLKKKIRSIIETMERREHRRDNRHGSSFSSPRNENPMDLENDLP